MPRIRKSINNSKKKESPSKKGRPKLEVDNKTEKLMLEDLARSGLTTADAKRLDIKCLSPSEITKLTGRRDLIKNGYIIPYHDEYGRLNGIYRIRSLESGTRFKDRKKMRYYQPAGTIPGIYLTKGIKWDKVLNDPKQILWVTEGEKKAARACRAGYLMIGLGGVWSWRSTKAGVGFLPQLDKIEWKGREVILAFDSDIAIKSDVRRALTAFAFELKDRGAKALSVSLGSAVEKIGVDDFFEAHGDQALNRLVRDQVIADIDSMLKPFNDEIAFITDVQQTWLMQHHKLINKPGLTQMLYANRRAVIPTRDGDREVNLANEWLAWPGRREHVSMTYMPGINKITPDNKLNLWRGWGVIPEKGDITLWAQLLDYLFDSAPEHRRWFLQWLAYPIQNPGVKMYTAAVLFSLHQGVGKSLLGITIGKLYGENFATISQEQMHGAFNEWAAEKQFILGDEITGRDNQERRRDADQIKNMITRDMLTINKKYQPPYTIPDCVNYLFTTQHPDAFLLEDNDRRFFIHEINGAPLQQKFYQKYDKWLRKENGAAALLWYLRNFDITAFNPHAPAPITDAKRDMIELSRSDLDDWAMMLKTDPDTILRIDGKVIKRELWTLSELRVFSDQARPSSIIGLSKSLRRAGFKPLASTTTSDGTKKLWAIRNQPMWLKTDHFTRADTYERDHNLENTQSKRKF